MTEDTSENVSELRSEIQQALGRAIDFVIRFASDHGMGGAFPQHVFQLQYFKPDNPTHATLVTENRIEHSFASFYLDWRKELNAAEPIAALNSLCEAFKNKYGVAMEKYWVRRDYGTMMVLRYFEKVGKFSHDTAVAVEIVEEFEHDLTSIREQIELVYYVEGLRSDGPFALWDGKVSFAPISDEDLVNYAGRRNGMLGFQGFYLNAADWICRIRKEGDKSSFSDFNNAADILDHILNALSLISEGNARFGLLSKEVTNTFLHLGRLGGGEPLNSGRGGPIHLMASDVVKLDNVLSKIVRVWTDERLKLLRLPLRRMRAAATRRSAADAFMDVVIALEGLLAHDTPALESTYRFRLRGAALLSDEFGSPAERLKSLSEMYSVRSRVVHGDDNGAMLDPLLVQASRILKSIFVRYLEFSEQVIPEDVIRMVDEWMVKQPYAMVGSP